MSNRSSTFGGSASRRLKPGNAQRPVVPHQPCSAGVSRLFHPRRLVLPQHDLLGAAGREHVHPDRAAEDVRSGIPLFPDLDAESVPRSVTTAVGVRTTNWRFGDLEIWRFLIADR